MKTAPEYKFTPLQQKIILALQNENAYPHKVTKVELEETHISWVFLTGKYAYK
jgi:aminoglycoside phosphotransferase family enzyme